MKLLQQPQSFSTLLAVIALLAAVIQRVTGDTVTPDKECYLYRTDIIVAFNTDTPSARDSVVIVAANNASIAFNSLSTCSVCLSGGNPPSGTLTFRNRLIAGSYRAVFRKQNGATTATSNAFRAAGNGQSCAPVTPKPTPSPSPAPIPLPTPQPVPATPRPTSAPTTPPTRVPIPPPVPAPTVQPVPATPQPTKRVIPPTSLDRNAIANQTLTEARRVIRGLVRNNSRLTPEFIRMAFHDCIHVCDGCIDLTDANNNGLAHPIQVLEPVVAQFENDVVTRADFWVLAAMVGAEVADQGNPSRPHTFPMKWFGRPNCETTNTVCTNAQGASVPCTPTIGPARNMPSTSFDGPKLFQYFSTEFSLTQRQVVALMGAHTVGHLLMNESNINGTNGWNVQNKVLHSEYYNALIAASQAVGKDPISLRDNASPPWKRANPSGVNHWTLTLPGFPAPPLVMLNPDIALVRALNASNTNPTTGFVNCAFHRTSEPGTPPCDVAPTFSIAAEFNDDSDKWLDEFSSAMDFMTTNGFDRTPCVSEVCPLTLR